MTPKKSSSPYLNKMVNSFAVYTFIKDMTTDFVDMPFYRQGLIDAKGNYLSNNPDIPVYYKLVINLKKLVNKIPDPTIKSKLKNMSTAISLFAEEIEIIGGDSNIVLNEINEYLKSKGIDLLEDMSVGGGNISGVTPVDAEGNPSKTGTPEIFLSKEAQKRHVKRKIILRRKKML